MFYKGLYQQYYLLYHGCVMEELVFVTARGGAVFHSPEPVLTLGPPAFIPWKGPRLLLPIVNGDASGVLVGRGPERGQGH